MRLCRKRTPWNNGVAVILLTFFVLFVFSITAWTSQWSMCDSSLLIDGLQLKIRCYELGDYEGPNFSNRIFFHETTRRRKLNDRQTCAIESAAFHNPDKSIQIFMLHVSRFDQSTPWLKVLSKYPNVEIILINEEDYFKNSPLEDWLEKGDWKTSPYSYVHLADYLRVLSAYKAGGMYLDLDVITFKNYDLKSMGDFFVLQSKGIVLAVSNAVFHLNRSHRFVNEMISKLKENYNPNVWGYHGTILIHSMLRHFCGYSRFKFPVINNCTDIDILPVEAFYGIDPSTHDVMYERATNHSISLFNNSYGVHEWNSKSKHEYIDYQSDQLYSLVARQHCPLTAELYSQCSSSLPV